MPGPNNYRRLFPAAVMAFARPAARPPRRAAPKAAAPAPASPVFEAPADGFVIRAWQHPSSLRSPPKINTKFANVFPVTELSGQAPSAAPAEPEPARAENAAVAGDAPMPREIYRQRHRWIRTYSEHSSALRSAAPAPDEVDEVASMRPPAAPQEDATQAAAVQAPTQAAASQAPEEAVVAPNTESAACQTAVMRDASTQTEPVECGAVSCQTEETAPAEPQQPEEDKLEDSDEEEREQQPCSPSAAQQLAALEGKSPSMAELDRLEKLLQAEHQKIMGGLADLPDACAPSHQQRAVHQEWLDHQVGRTNRADCSENPHNKPVTPRSSCSRQLRRAVWCAARRNARQS